MAAGSTLNANGFLTTTIDELTVNGRRDHRPLETDGGATLASVIVEGNGVDRQFRGDGSSADAGGTVHDPA